MLGIYIRYFQIHVRYFFIDINPAIFLWYRYFASIIVISIFSALFCCYNNIFVNKVSMMVTKAVSFQIIIYYEWKKRKGIRNIVERREINAVAPVKTALPADQKWHHMGPRMIKHVIRFYLYDALISHYIPYIKFTLWSEIEMFIVSSFLTINLFI